MVYDNYWGLILFTLTYVGWRKYKGERKKKSNVHSKIDNAINKDMDCKVYSLTIVAEENRMRSTIIKTSMEVHDVLFNLLRDHNDHTVVCTVKST